MVVLIIGLLMMVIGLAWCHVVNWWFDRKDRKPMKLLKIGQKWEGRDGYFWEILDKSDYYNCLAIRLVTKDNSSRPMICGGEWFVDNHFRPCKCNQEAAA